MANIEQQPINKPVADPPIIPPMRSIHTNSLPEILRQHNISVAVSTYDLGRMVLLRSGEGPLNAHYRTFPKPMGIAAAGDRLAVGTYTEIWEFRNVPSACSKLDTASEPAPGVKAQYDACYLPRSIAFTGSIQIHEMAWAEQDELWFVNTHYSCLCTRSSNYSFTPRWKPPFITELAPEDRCHLNGLGLRDGAPRYVTALGSVNRARSWRENKKSGGVIMDVATNQIICSGLSMPHSPRWHDGKLWFLESGNGEIGYIDPATGAKTAVAVLPGFTRGLDFCGPYAFVGLSQVRDSAMFSGIAIAERPVSERCCGVWVVDLRNAKIAAFLKFEAEVQEIFAVQVLSGTRWPELVKDDLKLLEECVIPPAESPAQ